MGSKMGSETGSARALGDMHRSCWSESLWTVFGLEEEQCSLLVRCWEAVGTGGWAFCSTEAADDLNSPVGPAERARRRNRCMETLGKTCLLQ